MKIYTKHGDKGQTSLIGGVRVPKYDDRVEAYGSIDELNSYIGLIYDLSEDKDVKSQLQQIQERLFVVESHVAAANETVRNKLPKLIEEDILFLEKEMDKMSLNLPELKNFILPGGHPLASYAHIARTICRRAERITIKASKDNDSDLMVLKYLNRLSDFLFILARHLANTLGEGDILWITKKDWKRA